jgi:hypothetical protein
MRPAVVLCAATFFLCASAAFGALAGRYSDGNLTVDLSGSDSLTGTIALSGNQYPATAHANGNTVDGTFAASGINFPFKATLDGDTMTFTSGDKTYTLKRMSAAAGNPLGGASASPDAAGPVAGYSVVTSTDFGKAMYTKKTGVPSVTAALMAAIPDLSHYFDGRPDIKGAYEDQKNHQSGGAIFAATLKGQAMKGVISCKLTDGNAGVTVVYCRTDAPQAEWAKLSAAPQAPAQAQAAPDSAGAAASASAPPDLSKVLGDNAQVVQFPDGTGSITIPDGWKTNAQSALSPIGVQGPADQSVFIGSSRMIYTPDAPFIKMVKQNQQRAQQMGMKPPPAPQMIVAEFTDPVQAMQDMWPQMSQLNQAQGGPAVHLDKIVDHKDIPIAVQGAKAAVITYEVTRTINGVSKQYRGIQRVQMGPVNNGSWMFTSTGFTAPVDSFDHDRKLMFAITQSEKINEQVVMQKMNEQSQQNMAMIKQQGEADAARLNANHQAFMQQQQQQFDTHEAQMAQNDAARDSRNQQFADYENQRSRMKDNQVEQILGYREVYDTQTGLSADVDLYNVNGVVNALNQAALDPNRFVQIPLRDLQDPR